MELLATPPNPSWWHQDLQSLIADGDIYDALVAAGLLLRIAATSGDEEGVTRIVQIIKGVPPEVITSAENTALVEIGDLADALDCLAPSMSQNDEDVYAALVLLAIRERREYLECFFIALHTHANGYKGFLCSSLRGLDLLALRHVSTFTMLDESVGSPESPLLDSSVPISELHWWA